MNRVISLAMVALLAGVPFVVISASVQGQTMQSRKSEADRLFLQGIQLYQASRYQEAIPLFESALGIYREIKDHNAEVTSLLGLGLINKNLGQYQKAISYYEQSLAITKRIGDHKGEATSLNNLGLGYNSLRQYQKAIDYYMQSLAILKRIGDRNGEARLINNLGEAYNSLGNYEKAINYYMESLAITRQISDYKGAATSLNNLGLAYNSLGQYQKAIDFYMQSLMISGEDASACISDSKSEACLGYLYGQATSLNNQGDAYNSLGQYQRSIDLYQQSLAIFRQISNRNGEAASLTGLGVAYGNLGQYQKSIDLYQQSLAIFKQISNRNGAAASLNNLGEAYSSLRQYQKAIDYYMESLAIKKQIGDRSSEANSVNSLGAAYYSLGQYQKAIDFFQQSLAIFQQISNRNGEAASLNNLGSAYHSLGQYRKAIDFYEQCLTIKKQIGDRKGEAASLNNLGGTYYSLGQYQKAIYFLQQSLAILKQIRDRNGEAASLNNLGAALNQLNQPEIAILFYKQSVNVRESIRKDIKGLPKEDQQLYINSVAYSYRNLADILIKQDRIMEALQVLDLLKIQELEDYLKNIKGSDRSAQGIRLLAPEQALSENLFEINFENSKEINNQLANQIQQIPKSEINKVPEYLKQIPQGTALIYPLILSDRLEIILFTPNKLPIHRTVAIKQSQLDALINDFRVGLQDYSFQDYKEPSRKLYNLLIKPIEVELVSAQTTTILYAPDGILRYIPLAALHDGKQCLVEKYRVSNLIAYSLSDFSPQPQIEPSILAGAFGGKLGEPKFGQTPLPATIQEVQTITNLFQNSVGLVENNFSRAAVEARFTKYNVLHFATHAYFSVGTPDESFILFGNGDKISLSELSNWQIPNVSLIVLSACQTGTGKLGSGVEILGFGYQAQKAGIKQAIASLWSVSDEGTQALMDAFYRELQKGDVKPTEALQRAQISLIKSEKYRHPFYWSAFFTIGNGL